MSNLDDIIERHREKKPPKPLMSEEQKRKVMASIDATLIPDPDPDMTVEQLEELKRELLQQIYNSNFPGNELDDRISSTLLDADALHF